MQSEKEIRAMLSLTAEERYQYSLKRIADFEKIWCLEDETGVCTYGDKSNSIIIPIWPFEEFASLCAQGEFEKCRPFSLEVKEFFEDYLPDFREKDYQLTVFPLPSNKGAVVDIDSFENDLQIELDQY